MLRRVEGRWPGLRKSQWRVGGRKRDVFVPQGRLLFHSRLFRVVIERLCEGMTWR